MADKRPFLVLIPGASQTPAHYGLLCHLLNLAGYPVFSAPLPTVGSTEKISVEDDTQYVRDKMIIPVLEHQQHDAILIMHSYSSLPGCAAAKGLSKSERMKEGKTTGIIGQICIAALLAKGGDGNGLLEVFGGSYPPHIRPDVSTYIAFDGFRTLIEFSCAARIQPPPLRRPHSRPLQRRPRDSRELSS